MQKNRLEAFSDGVLAIVITIMVLELKVPHSVEPAALMSLLPVFLSYLLSFVDVGTYRYPSRVRSPLGLHRLVCVRRVDLVHT